MELRRRVRGIRRADPLDADAISRIASAVQTLHATALPHVFQPDASASFVTSEILSLMEQPNLLFWVGIHDTKAVGYLYAEVQAKPATRVKLATTRLYIHQMGVLETHRGRGIGTALLQAARDFAAQHRVATVGLDVWRFNQHARDFYRAHGFDVVREELWSTTDGADPDPDTAT